MDAGAKRLLPVCLIVLSLSACSHADIKEPLTDEEKETIAFALKQARAAIAVLNDRVDACGKTSQNKMLDPVLLRRFSLTDREWVVALNALSNRADARCFNKDGVQHRALVALLQFRKTEKFYTGSNDIDVLYTPELICCMNGLSGSLAEMLYNKLDPKLRQQLESIPGIDEPFNIFKTVDALRAVNRPPIP